MRYVVEPMRPEDIDEVTVIEREAFTTAWSAEAYRRELAENRLARYVVLRALPENGAEAPPRDQTEVSSANWIDRLARWIVRLFVPLRPPAPGRGRIIGFAGMWLMVDEAHLTTIAVSPTYRGRGFGELLLVKALELALRENARVMTLEVRASNDVAQALYRKYGFETAGLRRRYYTDNNEDALIMTTEPIASGEFTVKFGLLREANYRRTGVEDP